MILRTAILDDEPLAIEVLQDYVERTASLQLAIADTDPFKVLKLVQENKVDLLLLDLQMPELTGIQFMKIVSDSCRIILTTAYPDYALESYEYNVTDYLLKPIGYERFLKAIEKTELQTTVQPDQTSEAYIFVKSGYKTIKLNNKQIVYIQAAGDYVEYHLADGSKVLSLDNLKDIQNRLTTSYQRVHKSYIINMEHIISIERSRITTSLKNIIPVGDSYKESFFERINN
ncbi:LytTR family DNA-binding domain-containing protein [Zhouia spongiae]|uniref:LytTR family DNA-binding domain-containing protein n=1 Tax=Zhouia spongiae TaxID=2202721 RepID=A0ABY3YKD3_9FLAO|nr:LytTR family DNA-binding domain-containing protein [Zhouia spongiae]UNY98053.1 LytTR family DNA-binding domain-containing protein [Zhouia spongiae]